MKIKVAEEILADIVIDLKINDSLHQTHAHGAPMALYGVDHIDVNAASYSIYYIQSGGFPSDYWVTFWCDHPVFVLKNNLVAEVLGKPLDEWTDHAETLRRQSEKELLPIF